MARRHGSKGQVKMDPTGGATTVAIGALNAWTLSLERDKADVTCFGDTTKQYVLGLPDISGDLKGVWDEALSPELIRVALGEVPVMLELIPSTIDPDAYVHRPGLSGDRDRMPGRRRRHDVRRVCGRRRLDARTRRDPARHHGA